MLKIIKYGDERLHRKAEFLSEITAQDKEIIKEMAETLYATNKGIGLAATQVAIMKMIFILDIDWLSESNSKKNLQIFINPQIIWESEEDEACTEGCLSFPELEVEIYRPKKIRLKYRNINFEEKIIEAEDFFARAIQHEIDHLNGIVIIDRITKLKRRLLAGKLNKLKRQTLSEKTPSLL